MQSSRTMPRPRIYFSFRSPYSWLAYHDLTTKYPSIACQADWRPFWEPDERSQCDLASAGGRFIYTPMSKEKHLYILRDVRRLVTRRGLNITWPIDQKPHWEVAHLAYLVAAEHGRGMEFMTAVYAARWQQGRDISDRTTIGELASELGLPRAALENAVDDASVRQRGTEALLAIWDDSVFGVPYFVNGRKSFWGIDRLALFIESLVGSMVDLQPMPVDTAAVDRADAIDDDHAGGCG